MRVQTTDRPRDERNRADESKRRDLKRLAVLACAVVLGSTFFTGCQTTKNAKSSKTVDEFLSDDKPQW